MTVGVADIIDAVRKKGINLGNKKKICISLDVNGPLTATDSAALEPYPGINTAMKALDRTDIYIIINSAWDIKTLSVFDNKKLGGIADGIIGENGAVYAFPNTEPIQAIDVNVDKHRLDLFIKSLKICSNIGYSFATQGNLVNACYYHEFERGLVENICRQGVSRPTAQEFFENLKKHGLEPILYGNSITIEESQENYEGLEKVLSNKYRLISIRPNIQDGRISIQLDMPNDKIISLLDLDSVAKTVISDLDGWENYRVNKDFCLDYFLSRKILKRNVSKATALKALVKDLCNRDYLDMEEILILGIGDGENDVCVGNIENALFFGMDGLKSERRCDIKVSNGMEFLHLVKRFSQAIRY